MPSFGPLYYHISKLFSFICLKDGYKLADQSQSTYGLRVFGFGFGHLWLFYLAFGGLLAYIVSLRLKRSELEFQFYWNKGV